MKTKLLPHYLQNLKLSVIRPATAGLLLILALSPEPCALSQVPQGFNYQAVARDASTGDPIINTLIDVKFGILSDTITPVIVREELFSSIKTNKFGMFSLVIGTGLFQAGSTTNFSDIDWTSKPLYLRIKIELSGSGNWKYMGSAKLWSVPYSMVASNLEGTVPLLSVKGNTTTMDSALFVVRNNTGQIVFAVYNEGVRIYVDDGVAKGSKKGGFAIGSFDKSKGTSQPLFVVDPDSIRAYLDNNPTKAVKGGFAIGGFDKSKSANQNFLSVSKDSIRMYIDDTLSSKSRKGGFAIGSFDKSKGGNINYLNVSTDLGGIINPSQNRILWYPLKNAFLTGKVLVESKDSVGVNSFASGYQSKSKGQYSQALGFQAIARGDYSTAIGKNALANKINSFAFGDSATAVKNESYAIGRGAVASGYRSFAFGSAGVDTLGHATDVTKAIGDYSFAIGQGSNSTGKGSFSMGIANSASGQFSIAIGYKTTAAGYTSIAFGDSTLATGMYSSALGKLTTSSGAGSLAMGSYTSSPGSYSTAMGTHTISSGSLSTATGYYTTAQAYASLAIGRYNTIVGTGSSWIPSDPLFVAGNGINSSTRSDAFVIYKNGNTYISGSLGIGTNAPGQKLDIIAGNGRVQTGYSWLTNSDIRYKKNIYTLEGCLEKVMAMRGVSFDLISDSLNLGTGKKNIGFIAQELENVVPEVVVTGSDGFKAVAYDKITAVLNEAIKEQQKQIETYKSEIQALEEKVDHLKSLENEVSELKTLVSTLVANQSGQGNK